MMNISDIDIMRDGGTIIFTITDDGWITDYSLQSPFLGEPRPIFLGRKQLGFDSSEEKELLTTLKAWYATEVDETLAAAITELENPPFEFKRTEIHQQARPYFLIKTVIDCLSKRQTD